MTIFISIKTILCENQGQVSKQGWPDFGHKLGQKTTHGAKRKQSTVYRVIQSSDKRSNPYKIIAVYTNKNCNNDNPAVISRSELQFSIDFLKQNRHTNFKLIFLL